MDPIIEDTGPWGGEKWGGDDAPQHVTLYVAHRDFVPTAHRQGTPETGTDSKHVSWKEA